MPQLLKVILSSACLCLFLSSPVMGQDSDDYPEEEFYAPVDDTPEEPAKETGPPMLGIQMTPPPTHAQEANGTTPDQGVYVRRVFPNTAADDMGIEPGDIILSINGTEIDSMTTLREVVNNSEVGDDVSVVVTRDGGLQDMDSTFKPWLNSVSKGRLDKEAEDRYRNMQKRRLARRMQANENRQNEINKHLDAHKRAKGDLEDVDDWNALSDQEHDNFLAKELGALPDHTLPSIEFPQIDFDFTLRIDVDSSSLEAHANDAARTVTPMAPLALLASIVPELDLGYVMDVNSNEF